MNKKIYIKQIIIQNWRNFDEPLKLVFNENFNEIKGKNGLGKTSILDAIDYMLFEKKSNGDKDFNKVQYDQNGFSKEKYPKIELILSSYGEDYKLETNNNKWFINNSKIDSREKYLEYLKQWLKIDLESLYMLTKPNFLLDIFLKTQKSSDKQKIREYIIQVINSSSNEKIDIQKFEENIEKKDEILFQKKEKEKELKLKKREFESIKSINPNVEINNDLNDLEIKKELQIITEKINKYKNIQDEISKLDFYINDIKLKINQLNNSTIHINTNNGNKINIWLVVLLLILGIIPGLIYIFYCLSKNKKNNSKNIYEDKSQAVELNNYYKEIETLQKKRESLVNDEFYKLTDINELFNRKSEIEQIVNSNNNSKQELELLKIKYSSYKESIDELSQEIENLKDSENKINQENKEIALKTDKTLKNIFPNLSISLFNQKENEDIDIKKNGIPFKYLNHASKQNIIFQFSEMINSKEIIPFFLIDYLESINNVYIPKNNQVIACKVSNDNGLILNGKNIY